MSKERQYLDICVIGGGPAGISACLELSRNTSLRVGLFEGDSELGGYPRFCHHPFFGMRDLKRVYSGPRYARHLESSLEQTSTRIYRGSRVLRLEVDPSGEVHRVYTISREDTNVFESRFIILAMGCFESPRYDRLIAGGRPAGIFTVGALQKLFHVRKEKAGDRALIIGSEHVAFSSVLTLWKMGTVITGIVEEGEEVQTYWWVALFMSSFFAFPIYRNTKVLKIFGDKRVEGAELLDLKSGKTFEIECDTIVLAGRFRPDISLLEDVPLEIDPKTMGPEVDTELKTSVPNVLAAGNVLRGANMHDLCALEGKRAAWNIMRLLEDKKDSVNWTIRMKAESPVRYVAPQKIKACKETFVSKSLTRPEIQLEKTLFNCTLEAYSGDKKVWDHSFRKIVGNTRIVLPIERFMWDSVRPDYGIVLKVRENK